MTKKIKISRKDIMFYLINDGFLFIFLIVTLYPMIYFLSSSFSSPRAIIMGKVWLWPVEFTLKGYKAVFQDSYIMTGYRNTIFYTIAGTMLNVVLTIMAAYPLSRKDFKLRNTIMMIFAFTMLFGGGLVPTYLLITNLGLKNNWLVMVIPGAITVRNVIITRTFYQSNIADEMLEAAKIDGCSDFQFIRMVVIPLSKSITAVMVLFYAVGHWNSFFNAFLYITKRSLYPLQLVLRDILIKNALDASGMDDSRTYADNQNIEELLKYSLIVVSAFPVMCLYPFVQKHFVKGVMIGAIKG